MQKPGWKDDDGRPLEQLLDWGKVEPPAKGFGKLQDRLKPPMGGRTTSREEIVSAPKNESSDMSAQRKSYIPQKTRLTAKEKELVDKVLTE